jgi:hypothetical protein
MGGCDSEMRGTTTGNQKIIKRQSFEKVKKENGETSFQNFQMRSLNVWVLIVYTENE